MPRPLLLFNVLLAELSLVFGVYIIREGTSPRSLPNAPVAIRVTAVTAVTPMRGTPQPGTLAAAIIGRNLFDPTRSELPISVPEPPKPSGPPPVLQGVLISDDTAIAYLEDQSNKRTSRYRVGDTLGDMWIATIAADHVVLATAHQMIRVVLRDPRKIRIAQIEEAPRNLTPPASPSEFRGVVPAGAAAGLHPRPPRGI